MKLKPLKSKPLITLITLLSLTLGFLGGIQYQKYIAPISSTMQYPETAVVFRIIDGDTLELSTGQQVRLYAVSCPDQGEPFYEEATNFTTQLTENQQISLEYEQGYESDKFGRLLAYVFISPPSQTSGLQPAIGLADLSAPTHPNEIFLNLTLARSGLARVVIYEKRRPLIYQDELLEAGELARKEKLGIWKD